MLAFLVMEHGEKHKDSLGNFDKRLNNGRTYSTGLLLLSDTAAHYISNVKSYFS